MSDPQRRAPAEDAYWYMHDVPTPKDKKRIASWGAGFIILAGVVLPLLFAFVLPLFAG